LQYADGNHAALQQPPPQPAPHPGLPEYDEPVPGIVLDDVDNNEPFNNDEDNNFIPPPLSPPRFLRHYKEYDTLTDNDIDQLREMKSSGSDYEAAEALFFQRELKHFSRDFWENEIRE
jgi:hypothetical protein